MKKYDLDILFNDKDLLEELIFEDESEEEVIEDDTVEEIDDDINENEEILSTLNKLTHITNESGQKVGSYCFVEEIMNIYGLSQEEVIDIAKHNGYKIMKVFPNEQVDGGLIIADKSCSDSSVFELILIISIFSLFLIIYLSSLFGRFIFLKILCLKIIKLIIYI